MKVLYISDCRQDCPHSGWSLRAPLFLVCGLTKNQFPDSQGAIPGFCPLPVLACAGDDCEAEVAKPGSLCADCDLAAEVASFQPQDTPEINHRVLAWVEDEPYPFVGYFDGDEWIMETEYLNCDTHRSDIFGPVEYWEELPERKGKKSC